MRFFNKLLNLLQKITESVFLLGYKNRQAKTKLHGINKFAKFTYHIDLQRFRIHHRQEKRIEESTY